MKQVFQKSFNRRRFIHFTASFLASLNLLSSFSSTAYSHSKTPVGLIMCTERKEAVKRALMLLPPPELADQRVLIKPNFNTAHPAPGSTHLDTLSTLIDELWERKAGEIIIGERSGPPSTAEVMEAKGVFSLAREKDVEVVNFDALDPGDLIHFQDDRLHWPNGFHIPRILTQVDRIIATPCLKTHQFGGVFTMALKLAVGLIPKKGTDYMRTLHGSPDMRKMIAEINLAYQPDLYLVDGVEVFTHGGPSTGSRVTAGITLISSDPVAVDAVGVAVLKYLGSTEQIMSLPIFDQEQLLRARELGLGISHPQEVDLLSDDAAGWELAEEIRSILDLG